MRKVVEIWFRYLTPIGCLVLGALLTLHGLGWLPGERKLPDGHLDIAIVGVLCLAVGMAALLALNSRKMRRRWRDAAPALRADPEREDGDER